MTIAVTGATGHLGRRTVEALLETQPADSVVAIVRTPEKADDLAARGVQIRAASYDDRAALDAALVGVERLLFVSGNEVGQRVAQHRAVIDAAVAAGVGHVVYTSAPRATTTALVLAPDHKATEEYLAASGLSTTILRNGWYHENYLPQVETARQTGTIVAAAGDGRVASAARADYAAAAAAVLVDPAHDGRIYELSGDVAWDYRELAEAVGRVIGAPVEYRPVDAATLVRTLTEAGLDESTAGFVAALDQNTADGLLAETNGALATLIGRPTTPLYDGLRAALA